MTLSINKYFCNNLQIFFATVIILLLHLSVFGQNIEFEKDTYDFGQVQYNSETKRYIKFKNTGSDTLIITSFPATACGCDMAKIKGDKTKFTPNEDGILIYEFDTKSSRKYNNTITILTNSNPSHTILRVKWEVLSDTVKTEVTERSYKKSDLNQGNLDSIIMNHASLQHHLNFLLENACCRTNYDYVMPGDYDIKGHLCDSVKILAVKDFNNFFNQNDLFEIFSKSENYYIRLISFEAFSQLTYSEDSLVSFFESEYRELMSKPNNSFPFERHWELYNRMLNIVSPIDKHYQNSFKIDLENYTYLRSISANYNYWGWISLAPASFGIVRNSFDFGYIYLNNHKKNTFELRSVIVVKNTTDKILVIAPYYDANTKCDKKSYRIDPKDEAKIEFRSVVNLDKITSPIERKIKIVNYDTKEEQIFTFTANFLR